MLPGLVLPAVPSTVLVGDANFFELLIEDGSAEMGRSVGTGVGTDNAGSCVTEERWLVNARTSPLAQIGRAHV